MTNIKPTYLVRQKRLNHNLIGIFKKKLNIITKSRPPDLLLFNFKRNSNNTANIRLCLQDLKDTQNVKLR